MFESIQKGPEDPMYILKKRAEEDQTRVKVDIGVGIYRDEDGKYQELEVVTEAKRALEDLHLGHDYGLTTGDDEFLELAAGVVFGNSCKPLKDGRISSVQTLSGTGANHLGALLLSRCLGRPPKVYIGVPNWPNTEPLFQHVGLETVTYPYVNAETGRPDLDSCLEAVRSAPRGSVFSVQGCCHNPLGADLTPEQWRELGQALKEHGHLPFIDIAYQGLGDGLDDDAFGVRYLAGLDIEMLVCQSFSKNFALYGERCGALHFVGRTSAAAANVRDQLRSFIRREYSSSPAFGARIVKLVLANEDSRQKWMRELGDMRDRLHRNRRLLHKELTEVLKTPGSWDNIIEDKGLFSCIPLNKAQCAVLTDKHHIYLPMSGRINVAGLNLSNITKTAKAIDEVAREVL